MPDTSSLFTSPVIYMVLLHFRFFTVFQAATFEDTSQRTGCHASKVVLKCHLVSELAGSDNQAIVFNRSIWPVSMVRYPYSITG
jgi:uncharacterized membrane protein